MSFKSLTKIQIGFDIRDNSPVTMDFGHISNCLIGGHNIRFVEQFIINLTEELLNSMTESNSEIYVTDYCRIFYKTPKREGFYTRDESKDVFEMLCDLECKLNNSRERFLVIPDLENMLLDKKYGKLFRKKIIDLYMKHSNEFHIICRVHEINKTIVSDEIESIFPTRIGFKVHDKKDSIIILGRKGCEELLNDNDGLIVGEGWLEPLRFNTKIIY